MGNRDDEMGTEELERNMRAGRARDVAIIGLIVVSMLAVINSGGLAAWTERLPSTPTNAWIAERAGDWHRLMTKLGPAAAFEHLRQRFKPE